MMCTNVFGHNTSRSHIDHRQSHLPEVNLLNGKDREKKRKKDVKNTQKKEECGFTMTKEEADKHLKQKTGAHRREGKGRDF